MDFPEVPVTPVAAPENLFAALGLTGHEEAWQSCFDFLIPVADAAILRAMRPDMVALAGIPTRGVIVTAPSDQPEYDFLSRFFCPSVGIAEDPVTGSAHCSLAPYWGERLGARSMTGYQASARGGIVKVLRQHTGRVILQGQAVTVFAATLAAPHRAAA
jgi:PhzF family phenazine biosynthesis protein